MSTHKGHSTFTPGAQSSIIACAENRKATHKKRELGCTMVNGISFSREVRVCQLDYKKGISNGHAEIARQQVFSTPGQTIKS